MGPNWLDTHGPRLIPPSTSSRRYLFTGELESRARLSPESVGECQRVWRCEMDDRLFREVGPAVIWGVVDTI